MKHIALAAALVLAAPAAAQSMPAGQLLIRESTPAMIFRWTAPAEAALEPALLAKLRAQGLKAQAELRRDSADNLSIARASGRPATPYSSVTRWTAAAETAPLLVLTSTAYGFTGGAHGSSGTSALWFDRRTKREVKLPDLFTSWPRAEAQLRAAYCPALDAERAKRRGANAAALADFNACPKFTDVTVAPRANDGIYGFTITADPYVAGPYAEGAYTVDMPVTAELLALVKPAYRPAFMAR